MSKTGELYGLVSNQSQTPDIENWAVFDKVINVLFIRKDQSQNFSIRSDYEVSLNRNGEYYFHKCIQKPEIKVEYKRVATNVGISVKLHITNFHMKNSPESSSKLDSFTAADGNPIERVVIQLGYFHQFPDFTSPTSVLSLDDFYKLSPGNKQKLYEELDCQVLAVYPTKMPPDGITTFECVVGYFDLALHSRQDSSDSSMVFGNDTTIEDYLFKTITKRYAGRYVGDLIGKTEIGLGGKVKLSSDDITVEYTGPFTDEAARQYGVRCYVSEKLKEEGFKDDSGRVPNVLPTIPQFSSVVAAFDALQSTFPALRFMATTTGDYIVYHKNDIPEDISNMLIRAGLNNAGQGIPAIYSITYAGLRVIQCPFTTMVKPFQKLSFTTRYNIASMIGYYYRPKEGEEWFLVINFAITFSTTGDENMMEITSTDSVSPEGGS